MSRLPCFNSSNAATARRIRASPKMVGSTPREVRSSSLTPNVPSRSAIASEIVGCETPSFLAACAMLPLRAAPRKHTQIAQFDSATRVFRPQHFSDHRSLPIPVEERWQFPLRSRRSIQRVSCSRLGRLAPAFSGDMRMQISIIGAGRVGSALARNWQRSAYDIEFAVRDVRAEKHQALVSSAKLVPLGEAAGGTDVLVLATPFNAAENAIQALGDISGKILLDTTNPFVMGPSRFGFLLRSGIWILLVRRIAAIASPKASDIQGSEHNGR